MDCGHKRTNFILGLQIYFKMRLCNKAQSKQKCSCFIKDLWPSFINSAVKRYCKGSSDDNPSIFILLCLVSSTTFYFFLFFFIFFRQSQSNYSLIRNVWIIVFNMQMQKSMSSLISDLYYVKFRSSTVLFVIVAEVFLFH